MEKLKEEKGADWVRVPFKGGGEAVNAIISGTTPIGLIGEGNVIGHVRAGTMTMLVMANNIRSPNFPNVPTLEETDYRGAPSRGWYGLFAPAGTPKPIIARLAHEVARIVDDRDFRQRMYIDRAVEPSGVRLEEFARFIRDERKTAERIVRASGPQPK